MGNILYVVFMTISGFTTAFIKGWTLAFVMMAMTPVLLCGMGVFGVVMEKKAVTLNRAYAQSGGYAEQALSSIRIVVSFGQEALEISNYRRFLSKAKEAGVKSGTSVGLSMGFFMFVIYLCYAYCFLMGAVWVDTEKWNDAEDRVYKAGDCMAVFFGVLFGLFSLGGAGPAFASVKMAQAAGRSLFDVLDRTPLIQQDDSKAKTHKIEGEIEFRNVKFYYPSRTD